MHAQTKTLRSYISVYTEPFIHIRARRTYAQFVSITTYSYTHTYIQTSTHRIRPKYERQNQARFPQMHIHLRAYTRTYNLKPIRLNKSF